MNERDLEHPQAGGAEVHCFEICKRLVAAGDEITLLSCGFGDAPAETTIDGVRVLRLGNRITYYALVPGAYRRLRRVRPFDAVVEDLNKFPFFARYWVRDPLVVWVHHLMGTTAFQQVAFPIAAAVWCAEQLVPRLYRHMPVVAVSPSTRDELVHGGMPRQQIYVIPNGLDHDLYRPGATGPGPVPTILSLGRVEPSKRNEWLVDAIAQLPGVRLVVAGAGTGLEPLRAHVAASPARDRVELRGFVDEAEKVRLFQAAHVLATASPKEGWGLTVLEAAACGTPAVATDAPGLRDAVRDGETGLLVREPTVAAFAAALRRVLEDSPLRARLAAGARAWAARFSWDAVTADVSAVIDEARGRGAAQPTTWAA